MPTPAAMHAALRGACDTIARMPATFMTWPGGNTPILPTTRRRSAAPQGGMTLDAARLWSYGEMRVPVELWRALQRYAVWIEPSLIAEWIRLMDGYARRQGRPFDEGQASAVMIWADPARDVAEPRATSLAMMRAGRPVPCVWTGADLTPASLDIDHAFPWSAWPCGDLWNLLPAHRRVNQHQKRDLLPSETVLRRARERILRWWEAAYLDRQDAMPARFTEEARASLPGLGRDTAPEEVFGAMALQRLRLRLDQGVPEWPG